MIREPGNLTAACTRHLRGKGECLQVVIELPLFEGEAFLYLVNQPRGSTYPFGFESRWKNSWRGDRKNRDLIPA